MNNQERDGSNRALLLHGCVTTPMPVSRPVAFDALTRNVRIPQLCCEIPLKPQGVAFVDQEDYPAVSAHRWYLKPVRPTLCYAQTYSFVRLHQFIMGRRKGYVIDHIDGNGLNCTRANLRWATQAQNRQNARPRRDNQTGYKGVKQRPNGFTACLGIDGRYLSFGTYPTALEAAEAYDFAAIFFFQEFARPNVL